MTDLIDRQAAIDAVNIENLHPGIIGALQSILADLPTVTPKQRTGHCKDCKYFEYERTVKFDDIPLIVAHEICYKWGNGCKTKEDGYCFLFEPKESEDEDDRI